MLFCPPRDIGVHDKANSENIATIAARKSAGRFSEERALVVRVPYNALIKVGRSAKCIELAREMRNYLLGDTTGGSSRGAGENMIFHFVLKLPHDHTMHYAETNQMNQGSDRERKMWNGRVAAAAFVFRCKAVPVPARR